MSLRKESIQTRKRKKRKDERSLLDDTSSDFRSHCVDPNPSTMRVSQPVYKCFLVEKLSVNEKWSRDSGQVLLCPRIFRCCNSMKQMQQCDWMAFNSQYLNFYRTDSNAIFNIVFACLLYIIISKSISYLSDKTRRNKCLKKGGLLRLSADLAFGTARTKCMQNKNGLKICRVAFQRIALLKVYQKSR